jgi:hypothetical protein
MKRQSAGLDLLFSLAAGATGGGVFAFGMYLFNIGGLATLVDNDGDAIAVAAITAPLLALFAISALVTLPSGRDGGTAGLGSHCRSSGVAGRRRRQPSR